MLQGRAVRGGENWPAGRGRRREGVPMKPRSCRPCTAWPCRGGPGDPVLDDPLQGGCSLRFWSFQPSTGSALNAPTASLGLGFWG